MRFKFKVRAGAIDDFKETEHPRGPDGKFTSGAAGGKNIQGGVTFPKEGSLANKTWHAIHLYEKLHGQLPTTKELKSWANSKGYHVDPNNIGEYLGKYSKWKTVVEKKKEPEEKKYPSTKEGFEKLSVANGFEKKGISYGKLYYEKGDVKVSFLEEHGTWYMTKFGAIIAKGDNMESLNSAMFNYSESLSPSSKPSVASASNAIVPDKHDVKTAKVYASVKSQGNFGFTKYGVPNTKGLPDPIKSAIKSYTGSQYAEINNAMRFEADFDNMGVALMRKILNLQKAFHITPPTTDDCIVGRKVGLSALKTMVKSAGLNHLSELQEGSILQDDAIVSTSHADHVWSGDVKFEIKIPKGSKAINVQDISHHSSEQETLLPPGSKFKINKIHQNHKGHEFYLEMELLP